MLCDPHDQPPPEGHVRRAFLETKNNVRTRRRGYYTALPRGSPLVPQRRLETYARTREWLPSCVRMIKWAHYSLGGREEGTCVTKALDFQPVGNQHLGRALTSGLLRRRATSPGGRSTLGRQGGCRDGVSDTI
jgi:hypothetical protein